MGPGEGVVEESRHSPIDSGICNLYEVLHEIIKEYPEGESTYVLRHPVLPRCPVFVILNPKVTRECATICIPMAISSMLPEVNDYRMRNTYVIMPSFKAHGIVPGWVQPTPLLCAACNPCQPARPNAKRPRVHPRQGKANLE